MLDLPEQIRETRSELKRATDARNRIEANGNSFSFGGSSFALVSYQQICQRVDRLKRELYSLEAQVAGYDVQSDVRVAQISSL